MRRPCSEELYRKALRLIPAGVSSPVRRFEPHPIYFKSGKGAYIVDADGKRYADYCLAYGPLILGHAHPYVVRRVRRRLEQGVLFGAPVEEEVLLARKIVSHHPSIRMVRFVSTGTEATYHAIRLARAATKRDLIVKMEGGFHGSHEAVLVKPGSGAFGAPSSAGNLEEVANKTLVVPFNDAAALRNVMRVHGCEVAAVITEPVLGNIGPVLPEPGYLQSLREECDRVGALLIFDEIITGYRLSIGGAQRLYRVKPDLTTLGKVLGGGLPLAAYGGRRDLMELVAPSGPVYQAGTFAGNPLSLTAGLATVEVLERTGFCDLNRAGDCLRTGLSLAAAEAGADVQVAGTGSMFQMFFSPRRVTTWAGAKGCDAERYMGLFRHLLSRGFYLPPSQFETCFLSTAHGAGEVERFVAAVSGFLKRDGVGG